MKKFLLSLLFLLLLCLTACDPLIKPEPLVPVADDPKPITVTLNAVGDNLIHYPIYEYAYDMGKDHYDFSSCYAPIAALLGAADITFLNQEITTAGEEYGISSYPMFNSPKELAYEMAALGVDVVNQASNHSLDSGLAALIETLDLWHSLGVKTVGVYQEETDSNIQIIERNGLSFAFLGYDYGLNGFSLDDWQGYKIAMLDDETTMFAEVDQAKTMADFVIVSLHWGNEGDLKGNDAQRELAQKLADHNVDLILGHHPHVIQPVDLLLRADGKTMPVFYSLGNLISNQIDAENMLGGMAQVTFVKDGDGTSVQSPVLIPLVTHFETQFWATRVYLLQDYTTALAARHGILGYDSRFSCDYLQALYESVVSEEFRPAAEGITK
ncbi:MAG TPA: CapA family protein [Bacillota bacterium]|nr:CapA family protein [Bacillota bacterium]